MTAAATSWKLFCKVEMHWLAVDDDFAEGKSQTVHGAADATPEGALWSNAGQG